MAPGELFAIPGFADPFSSLSHLLGAVLFGALAVPLVRRGARVRDAHRRGRVVSLVIFAVSAVALLSLSGAFHLLERDGRARHVLQILDHDAIFVLIAGTFTPIHTILFRGRWRWGMLAFIWSLAAIGVTFKTIFFSSTPVSLGVAIYLGMGWTGSLSGIVVWRRFGARLVAPLAFGGVAYTFGAVLEWAEPAPMIAGVIRAHEVFHVCVLLGLALHWKFVWSIASMEVGAAGAVPPKDALPRHAAFFREHKIQPRFGPAAAVPGERSPTHV